MPGCISGACLTREHGEELGGLSAQGDLLPPPCWDEELVALQDSVLVSVSPDVHQRLLRLPAAADAIVDALLRSSVSGSRAWPSSAPRCTPNGFAESSSSSRARETVTCSIRALEREGFVVREGRRYRLAISPTLLDPEPP